jgi:hypothetical protein
MDIWRWQFVWIYLGDILHRYVRVTICMDIWRWQFVWIDAGYNLYGYMYGFKLYLLHLQTVILYLDCCLKSAALHRHLHSWLLVEAVKFTMKSNEKKKKESKIQLLSLCFTLDRRRYILNYSMSSNISCSLSLSNNILYFF